MTKRVRPQGPFKKMVVLGESTVEGGGWVASNAERYADVLWKLLETAQEQPLEYINAGKGGSVISAASPGYEASPKPAAVERVDPLVIANNPDLLLVAYGLNDMRAGFDVDEFRAEYCKLLERVDASICPQIVMVNVYYMPYFKHFAPFDVGSRVATLAYNEMLRSVAAERGLIYADVYGAEEGLPHMVNLDGVHANKIGNMLIAQRIFEAIVRACPGLGANMLKRDESTKWTNYIRGLIAEEGKGRG